MMFFVKVLLRLLSLKKSLKLNGTNGKHALISYMRILPKPVDFKFFYDKSHNKFLKSFLMAYALNKKGYTVHIYDYLDENISTDINYDIFIGHNVTFSRIANKVNNDCKAILLITGSSPEYDNDILQQRNSELKHRKKVDYDFFKAVANVDYAKENCERADYIFMIGNRDIAATWYPVVQEKVSFYNNVNLLKFKRKKGRTNNFIYMSSVGQLRRGLDLVIDTFAGREEKVYICGPYQEEAFLKLYSNELHHLGNIIPVGFVDQTSKQFMEIIADCDFAILPSCSEGQSGSALTLMSYGMVPLLTKECGLTDVSKYGIEISAPALDKVRLAVDNAVCLTAEQMEDKRDRILSEQAKYSKDYFEKNFSTFIAKINA